MIEKGILLSNRYEIIGRIGTGGMADVYKAMDQKLNRLVALKVLKQSFSDDENFVSRFHTEAQAAASLMHPNVVNVYDYGIDRGHYFMVMELVDGITLKKYIERKGKLTAKEVISIVIQIASGLESAHRNNLIHRDIKPQNIMISREGKVKVTDFGIAKAVTSNTVSTNAMGSVHYTSPEQARGGFSDVRSDVYSLGVTMYEMVTGRVPFDGDSTVAIAMKHLQENMIMPSEYAEDIPYSLEQIIVKCMQKNADRRYQDMAALIRDLKHSLVDPDGDFVIINPITIGDTVVISQDELEKVRRGNRYEDDDEEEYEDEYEDEDDYEEDSHGEVNPRMKKLMKILKIVVVLIIIFVIGLGISKAAGLIRTTPSSDESTEDDGKREVPNLLGKTETDAKELLNDMDLGIRVDTREESDEYEEGEICEQKTEAGTEVDKNTTIHVVVSSGLKGSTVPNVVGDSEDEATKTLEDAGFEVETEAEYSSDVDEGKVISQSPMGGRTLSKGSTVTITISKGAEIVSVPKITGMTEEDAREALKDAGLAVGNVTEESSDSVAEGKVISQGTASGNRVATGTKISFVVSTGEDLVEVPSIKGLSKSKAIAALTAKGLNAGSVTEEYSSSVKEGYVISQGTASGKKVASGTSISFVVSKGEEKPDDTNATESVWKCNTNVRLGDTYQGGPAKVVLTQNGKDTVLVNGSTISNPYNVNVVGQSGVSTGTVTFYEDRGDGYIEIATATVNFKKQ